MPPHVAREHRQKALHPRELPAYRRPWTVRIRVLLVDKAAGGSQKTQQLTTQHALEGEDTDDDVQLA